MDDRYIISMEAVWEIRRLLSSMRNHPNIYQALEIFDRLSQSIEIVGNEVCIKDEHPRIKKFMEREGSKEKPIGPIGIKAWSILTAMEEGGEMRKEFKFHKLNEDGIKKAKRIAEAYSHLADAIRDIVQEGSPEYTISLRKLEESCFYAKKAMAEQERNQSDEKEQPEPCEFSENMTDSKGMLLEGAGTTLEPQEVSDGSQEIMEKDLGEPCDVVPDQG